MKIYPSINIELENGKTNRVIYGDLDFEGDWNTLKDAKNLLERWAEEQAKIEAIVEAEGITWEQACDKFYE